MKQIEAHSKMEGRYLVNFKRREAIDKSLLPNDPLPATIKPCINIKFKDMLYIVWDNNNICFIYPEHINTYEITNET